MHRSKFKVTIFKRLKRSEKIQTLQYPFAPPPLTAALLKNSMAICQDATNLEPSACSNPR